jgi:hypothetical protein
MHLLILVLTLLLLPAPTSLALNQAGWRTYTGAWFEIRYPANFQVHPSLQSGSASGYDSVFFTSPDGAVEFYVFSPQWNGTPTDIEINPSTEIVTSQKFEQREGKTSRRISARARNGSYLRAFEDIEDHTTNTRRVFGISYRNQASYNRYRQMYLTFKASLTQFAD